MLFFMAFGLFVTQLQWSSSQYATHLSVLKISIVDSYINFQSCALSTFIYHDTFCRKVVNEVCSFVGIKCCSRSYLFAICHVAILPFFQNSSYFIPLNLIARDFAKFLSVRKTSHWNMHPIE